MDNDLERSVRLLEDALTIPGKGLFKTTLNQSRKTRQNDLSNTAPLSHHEIRKILEGQSRYDETMSGIFHQEKTMTGSIIQARTPWKAATDSLYMEFLEILQSYSGGHDVLEIVSDLARCCSDALTVVKGLTSKVSVPTTEEEEWLENERNTWRLLLILYQDRFRTRNVIDDEILDQYFGLSEKMCVENLYKRDHLLRECQLVIDWLENNSADKDDEALHYSDSSLGWENTLHQLKSSKNIAFESSRKIVDKMYPDAPYYQNLPLHDLDIQDEKRLTRKIFWEVRCGKLVEAQKICRNSGHGWRAALYEGWRLYHNPNIIESEDMSMDSDDKENQVVTETECQLIEGNASRDIWKLMAIKYCKQIIEGNVSLQPYLDPHEKATIAALSGNLEPLLAVCDTWEDYLWAYMRVMVDIRVESEIRDCINRSYAELPTEYWEQRMSLNDLFDSLESSRNDTVRESSKKHEYIIQKHIILDEIPRLITKLEDWTDDEGASTQFVRFAAHLALFLEQTGQAHNRDAIENILEVYIKRLCDMNETMLVAYYISKLGSHKQVHLYAAYLERIVDNEERLSALNYAENFGINVLACTKQVVENIRNHPHEIEETGGLQYKMTDADKFKISALDWVIFNESQRAEAIQQANCLIFSFLTLRKLDAAQLAFNKIPPNSLDKVLAEGQTSADTQLVIKEYLSYKTYIDAQEAFNDWFRHYQNKPNRPDGISESAPFTEKVAHEHRMAQYKADLERWKLTLAHLAKIAKTMLYNVLLFPEGWLVGAQDAEYLRSICLPDVTMLLYNVLYDSELYEECVQIADILASEKHKLYEVYSKEKIREFMHKIAESSVALLNMKKDPFGQDVYA